MPRSRSGPTVSAIPFLGSGLGYREELRQAILDAEVTVDLLEVVTEKVSTSPAALGELEELCDRFTVIPHGVSLSAGSVAPLDEDHLRSIRRVSDLTGCPYYSEHLALTRVPGIDIGHLSPLWFTEVVLDRTIQNVQRVQDVLGKPLVLENVTYMFEVPGPDMGQAEFFTRLVDATGCGLLLDVTNLHINSVNHGFDPVEFLEAMPLEHVVQVHLAGGYWYEGTLIDGHCEPVPDAVWALLEWLAGAVEIRASILEHDARFPDDPSTLLQQVDRARHIIETGRGAATPPERWS